MPILVLRFEIIVFFPVILFDRPQDTKKARSTQEGLEYSRVTSGNDGIVSIDGKWNIRSTFGIPHYRQIPGPRPNVIDDPFKDQPSDRRNFYESANRDVTGASANNS